MAKWLLSEHNWKQEQARINWIESSIKTAVKDHAMKVVKYLCSIRSEANAGMALNIAAGTGDLEMVKLLDSHKAKAIKKAMENAIANGHLEVVKWLHAHRSDRCASSCMDIAAKNGHLAIMKCLHAHQMGRCTAIAMEMAAAHGHQDVAEWIHQNQSAPISLQMLEDAAAGGYLGIVQFLCAHTEEDAYFYNEALIEHAATNGHLEVVQWLLEKAASERNDDEYYARRLFLNNLSLAVRNAALNGHLSVVEMLLSAGADFSRARVNALGTEYGQFAVLEWILKCGRSREQQNFREQTVRRLQYQIRPRVVDDY